jgi:phosphoribosylformylglycinamidine synthase subunit PurSL
MAVRRLLVAPLNQPDPLAESALRAGHSLGLTGITALRRADIVHVDGPLEEADLARLGDELLAHPLLASVVTESDRDGSGPGDAVEVAPRPGVHDATAEELLDAARRLGFAVDRVATARRWWIDGDAASRDELVRRVLVNEVVERHGPAPLTPAWPEERATPPVARVALRDLDDAALVALDAQRGLSLDPAELVAIREHFAAIGRDPTDAELEMLAQTWSEHCCHKTFRAWIEHGEETLDGLLSSFLRRATDTIAAPWVRSAFVDDARVVAFTDDVELAIKAETHNHPSAIEPFGGANTGVGGVLRDVLGVGARPIGLTDVLCFGPLDDEPPAGVLHPRRVRDGVVAGVGDYGNKIGVPTVAGAVLHHPGFTTTPLVFCGCLGARPPGTTFPGPTAGDLVVVLGGATGRDGVGGATFSSRSMGVETALEAGSSVQIGDPITEKGLVDVIHEAVAAGLVQGLTDCGAGGLSSAIGELADPVGATVQLTEVRRKYAGLAPWEVWLSEAQERMVLAVEPARLDELRRIAARHEVALDVVGSFTGEGRLHVLDGRDVVVDLSADFLHRGRPRRHLGADPFVPVRPARRPWPDLDAGEALLAVLGHPDVVSKEPVVRTYDHEVLGRTVVRPMTGPDGDGPSDGTVLRVGGPGPELHGVALGIGVSAVWGDLDPERMAHLVVDEAVRNVVAAGADPDRIALLDNFAWGDPSDPATLGGLVAACRGAHDAAIAHRAPFVSGKDSLNNVWVGPDGRPDAVPSVLVVTALGHVEDVSLAQGTDLVATGDRLYLVGDGAPVGLRGSHLDLALGEDRGGEVPAPDPEAPARHRAVHWAIRSRLVRAVHDLADGGLAVAAAEMAVGGGRGLVLELQGGLEEALFAEGAGRYLVEVSDEAAPAFEAGVPDARLVGVVVDAPRLSVTVDGETCIDQALDALRAAFAGDGR